MPVQCDFGDVDVIGPSSCSTQGAARYRMLATSVSVAALASVVAMGVLTPAPAKAPGEQHCYKQVCHRVYTLEETRARIGLLEELVATHYDDPSIDRMNTGKYTSSGEEFNAKSGLHSAASNFPDGTQLLLWHQKSGRASHVRINDFGPFWGNRTLDVTRRVADELGFAASGVARLKVIVLYAPTAAETRYRKARRYGRVGGYLGVFEEAQLPDLARRLIEETGEVVPLVIAGKLFDDRLDAAERGVLLPDLQKAFRQLANLAGAEDEPEALNLVDEVSDIVADRYERIATLARTRTSDIQGLTEFAWQQAARVPLVNTPLPSEITFVGWPIAVPTSAPEIDVPVPVPVAVAATVVPETTMRFALNGPLADELTIKPAPPVVVASAEPLAMPRADVDVQLEVSRPPLPTRAPVSDVMIAAARPGANLLGPASMAAAGLITLLAGLLALSMLRRRRVPARVQPQSQAAMEPVVTEGVGTGDHESAHVGPAVAPIATMTPDYATPRAMPILASQPTKAPLQALPSPARVVLEPPAMRDLSLSSAMRNRPPTTEPSAIVPLNMGQRPPAVVAPAIAVLAAVAAPTVTPEIALRAPSAALAVRPVQAPQALFEDGQPDTLHVPIPRDWVAMATPLVPHGTTKALDVRRPDAVRVDGKLYGSLAADRIYVAPGAQVTGTLRARQIIISGSVVGTTSAITLVLDMGASVQGECICAEFGLGPGARAPTTVRRANPDRVLAAAGLLNARLSLLQAAE